MFSIARASLIILAVAASVTRIAAGQQDDYASEHMKWPMSSGEAESILANTKVFASERVYRDGRPSPQVVSFNIILDSSDALERFDRLASGTNAVGRLYALCGYQVLSRRHYKALREVLLTVPEKVDTQFGCLGDESSIADLVGSIDHSKLGRGFRRARNELYDDLQGAG